jgi:hypothetical protein
MQYEKNSGDDGPFGRRKLSEGSEGFQPQSTCFLHSFLYINPIVYLKLTPSAKHLPKKILPEMTCSA